MGCKCLQFAVALLAWLMFAIQTNAETGAFTISPVLVSYETVGEGDPIPAEAFEGEETASWLNELIQGYDLGGRVVNMNVLREDTARLVRSNTPAIEAREDIKALCNNGVRGVLLQHLRVKVGVPRGWEYEGVPFFGGNLKPIVNQSTARYRAVVRSCHTGEVQWRGEFQIRGIPTRGHEGLLKKLNEVYERFEWENNDDY